ncbi:MAG: hypothetical protein JNL19_02065 [Burkholderiales bacterium]|nr:hypothetical protein [Burkholderiales bacterium]
MTITFRPRAPLLALIMVTATPLLAVADDLRWSAADTVDGNYVIAPGKSAELCGMIDPRLPVDWQFQASGPVEFNIHRHDGNDIVYATRSYRTREQTGRFSPTLSRHWCWMWSNEGTTEVTVRVALKR